MFKQDVLVTSPSNGAKVWDNSLKQVRNILGVDGIATSIFVDSANPSNPQNNAIIVSGAGITSNIQTYSNPGAKIWDSTNKLMRNIVGTGGISASVYLNLDNPDDPMNQQVVIDGSGISGGGL